jgi:uncharacterized membrane protein YkoI
MKFAFAAALGLVVLVMPARAQADEESVPLTKVPKPVLDAVKAKYPKAELKAATKETHANKTVTYEISIVNQGKKMAVSLDQKGEIEEVETEIAIQDLPHAVTDAIAAKYPRATLKKAEEIVEIEDGKEEKEFEIEIVTSQGKSVELKVDANGKIDED